MMFALLLTCLLAEPADEARALLLLASTSAQVPVKPAARAEKPPDHEALVQAAIRRAIAFNRPLVVWVGMRARPELEKQLGECDHVHAPSWRGERGPGVIVMRTAGDWLLWDDVLPEGGVNAAAVQRRLRPPTQPQPVLRSATPARTTRSSNC